MYIAFFGLCCVLCVCVCCCVARFLFYFSLFSACHFLERSCLGRPLNWIDDKEGNVAHFTACTEVFACMCMCVYVGGQEVMLVMSVAFPFP